MSGGHFEYKSFDIGRFAKLLQHELEINDCQRLDKFGDTIGYNFEAETVDCLSRCLNRIELAGDIAKEVEWLYSGDRDENSFIKFVNELL